VPTPPEQPIGDPLEWSPAASPAGEELVGTEVVVRPIRADRDAEPFYAATHPPAGDEQLWTYLFDGPYGSVEEMERTISSVEGLEDPRFYTVERSSDRRPLGRAAYMRIEPASGVIEIGSIIFAPELQRTRAATEAIYLLIRHAFDELGYRRVEWKCDSLNAPSRRAAERFGFSFEGVFRKHMVVKGRNRDTAWFAIVDDDWPENFDADGVQRQPLSAFTKRDAP
jgi:RimJ/RimL family protein N-acetyltransferase